MEAVLFWWARSVLSIHKIKTDLIFIKGSKALLTEIMKGTFTGLVTEAVIFLKKKKKNFLGEVWLVVPLFLTPPFFSIKEGRIAG